MIDELENKLLAPKNTNENDNDVKIREAIDASDAAISTSAISTGTNRILI